MSNAILPPPPYSSPLTTSQGAMTVPWSNWIKQLFIRAGGPSAPSNLSIVNNSDALTALQTSVTTLQATVNSNYTSLSASVATLTTEFNGLGQGRQL